MRKENPMKTKEEPNARNKADKSKLRKLSMEELEFVSGGIASRQLSETGSAPAVMTIGYPEVPSKI